MPMLRLPIAARLGLLPMLICLAAGPVSAEDEFEGLPPGPGQEETFYACAACHSIRLVTQQGLSRERWDETLEWMVEEQEMDPLEPEERALVLDYLSNFITPEWHKERMKNR